MNILIVFLVSSYWENELECSHTQNQHMRKLYAYEQTCFGESSALTFRVSCQFHLCWLDHCASLIISWIIWTILCWFPLSLYLYANKRKQWFIILLLQPSSSAITCFKPWDLNHIRWNQRWCHMKFFLKIFGCWSHHRNLVL